MVNIVGSALTAEKNVMDVPFIKVTLHGVNANSMHAFQSIASSIVDSAQTFHATSKLDTLIQIIPKVKETP